MKKQDWVWMPHAAHFCAAASCRFRLATYVGGYIVSTVGEYFPRDSKEPEEIGLDRKYETYVFKAVPSKHKCCPWAIDSGQEIDSEGYNDADTAADGHMAMCEKWSAQP